MKKKILTPTELIQKLEQIGLVRLEIGKLGIGNKHRPITDWYADWGIDVLHEVEAYVGNITTELSINYKNIGTYHVSKEEYDKVLGELRKLEMREFNVEGTGVSIRFDKCCGMCPAFEDRPMALSAYCNLFHKVITEASCGGFPEFCRLPVTDGD